MSKGKKRERSLTPIEVHDSASDGEDKPLDIDELKPSNTASKSAPDAKRRKGMLRGFVAFDTTEIMVSNIW